MTIGQCGTELSKTKECNLGEITFDVFCIQHNFTKQLFFPQVEAIVDCKLGFTCCSFLPSTSSIILNTKSLD